MRWHRFVCRGVSAALSGDQAPDGVSWAGWGNSKELSRRQLEFIFAKLHCPTPQGTNGTAPPTGAPPAITGAQEGTEVLGSHPSISEGGKGRYHFAETWAELTPSKKVGPGWPG